MPKETVRSRATRPSRVSAPAGAPTHPVWKANFLMIGIVLLLVVISVASVGAGK